MAHTKAGGTAKNLRDSNPKYLGVKRADGAKVGVGEIVVRQRGTKIMPGHNIRVGKDHTLFAKVAGLVKFSRKRKTNYDGRMVNRSSVETAPHRSEGRISAVRIGFAADDRSMRRCVYSFLIGESA